MSNLDMISRMPSMPNVDDGARGGRMYWRARRSHVVNTPMGLGNVEDRMYSAVRETRRNACKVNWRAQKGALQ
ncbi:MAG: hypothetical protein VX300_05240 [Acidobacteriota bacterium]|nr:hypothetical protein [Acidobacteriota bacterium]